MLFLLRWFFFGYMGYEFLVFLFFLVYRVGVFCEYLEGYSDVELVYYKVIIIEICLFNIGLEG